MILWLDCKVVDLGTTQGRQAGLRDAVERTGCHSQSGISSAGEGTTEHLGQLDSVASQKDCPCGNASWLLECGDGRELDGLIRGLQPSQAPCVETDVPKMAMRRKTLATSLA